MNRDRELLFGATAMLAGLIDADQLAEACGLWSACPARSLSDVLCEKGWVLPQDLGPINHLVDRRVSRCGGDPRASLLGCPVEIAAVLGRLPDRTTASPRLGQNTVAYEGDEPHEAGWGKSASRYTLRKLHAAGGIGEIWLASDADFGRDVAVKRLHAGRPTSSAARSRFLREAKITGRLDHPGVVPVYEICVDEATGQPYYSMRFLKGKTLTAAVLEYHREREAGRGNLQTFLELLGAFCVVCNTVAYAHSKGIIHRDLKCDNVILGDYGEVVVIDWGLAKEVGGAEEAPVGGAEDVAPARSGVTLAGHILGTPAYMAPEQASGRLDLIGPSTDVYGLSAILYEILCGRPPFVGENTLEVLQLVRRENPVRPGEIAPGVPEVLERICLKGLAKDQADRHPSADLLAKAVQGWVGDLAERRQAEEERERFFALSLDLLAIVDSGGRFRQVSPAWERLLGHDRERLVGRPFADVIHPDDRPAAAARLGGLIGAWAADTFEARVLGHDGNYRWVSWNVTPIAKEQCAYAVGRDVTELKRSQQLFEGVMQSAPDALILVNPQGRIAMANRRAEQTFGYRQDELLGQRLEILVPERFRERHPAHVASFFAAASFRPMGAGLSLWGVRKDGREFQVEIALSSIATETGPLVAASVRESPDRKPNADAGSIRTS